MANIITNGVCGIGISNNMPTNVKYFQEISVVETLKLPSDKPDIEKLSSVIISPRIISSKIINTPVALSYEGQNLSGYKLIVQVNLEEKIKYVARLPHRSVHSTHYSNVIKSIFVVVPSEINGKSVCDLIRTNKYSINPYVEDIYAVKKDDRTIYKCVTILVDVNFF